MDIWLEETCFVLIHRRLATVTPIDLPHSCSNTSSTNFSFPEQRIYQIEIVVQSLDQNAQNSPKKLAHKNIPFICFNKIITTHWAFLAQKLNQCRKYNSGRWRQCPDRCVFLCNQWLMISIANAIYDEQNWKENKKN